MVEKKLLSNRRFAISYILGVGIVGGIISKVINFLMQLLSIDINAMVVSLNYGISFIIWLFSIWLGAIIICWYLNNRFKIENKQKVLNLAVIYFVILYVIIQIISVLTLFSMPFVQIKALYFLYIIIQLLISSALIYFLGKKYIRASSVDKSRSFENSGDID
jgi:uncharacterized membrane protein YidH (DUF202 family)